VARYVPWLAGLNLVWELVQLPLYTIWSDAMPGEIAFAVAHCTLGDVLIGAAAMLIALLALRAPALERWNWTRIGLLAVLLGVAYTAFSEWMNTTIRPSWQYSNLMPVIHVGDAAIGLSPLAQWLILPPIGLYLAARGRRSQSVRG
jgi:hypothetical protein